MFNCDETHRCEKPEKIQEFADRITFARQDLLLRDLPIGLAEASATGRMKGFLFLKDAAMGPEEYSIEITKRNCTVKASAFNGFLYSCRRSGNS